MKLLTQSRLLGVLLIAASLPFDTGLVLSVQAANQARELQPASAPASAMEARLQRIAEAARQGVGNDAISYVVIGPGGLGWANGGFGNGGFYNGGWGNGGFGNGGFYNGGFRNGGFYNGGFRNGGFRNW
jgi:hypothetical protein